MECACEQLKDGIDLCAAHGTQFRSDLHKLKTERDQLLELVITYHDNTWRGPRVAVGRVDSHLAGDLPKDCEVCELVREIKTHVSA